MKGDSFINVNKTNSLIKGDFISPIYSDKKGNIWLEFSKPNKGIANFDGKNWTIYNAKTYSSLKRTIVTITEDNQGNILIGTSNGVVIYNGVDWAEMKLPVNGFDSITVLSLDVDSNGRIAIGHNWGLLIYENGNWSVYNKRNSGLQLNTVRAVKFLKTGELCIGYGGGLGDGGFSILNNNKWEHYNIKNSKLPDQTVSDIELMNDGTLWLATNDGVAIFNGKEITPIKFREGKYHNTIMGIAKESEKIIWLITNFGLVRYEIN